MLRLFKSKETVEIGLGELSVLWLPETHENTQEIEHVKWKCETLNEFQKGYIDKYVSITSPHYNEILSEIFQLFEKPLNGKVKEHSIKIAKKCVDRIQNGVQTPTALIPEMIVAALAHDIGEIEIEEKSADHIANSILFISKHLTDFESAEIKAAIKYHHSKKSDIPGKSPIVFTLNQIEGEFNGSSTDLKPEKSENKKSPALKRETPEKPEEKEIKPVTDIKHVELSDVIDLFSGYLDDEGLDVFYNPLDKAMFVKESMVKQYYDEKEINSLIFTHKIETLLIRIRFVDKSKKPVRSKYFIFEAYDEIPEELRVKPEEIRSLNRKGDSQ